MSGMKMFGGTRFRASWTRRGESLHFSPAFCSLLAIAFLATIANLEAVDTKWTVLENCHFVQNPGNDGDSFHVRANDKEYVFRLYHVDSPEVDGTDPQRLVEQAKYFGINVPQVIELGERAKTFVEKELAGPFKVTTRMANAMGRSNVERFYAFVETKDGDLSEQLVANGLARVHGRIVKPPGVSKSTDASKRLKQLANEAKQRKLGGWAPNFAGGPGRISSGKIDINTATEKELESIPGVGPKIARRIMDARPFESADDLKRVNGISDKNYAQFRPYFR